MAFDQWSIKPIGGVGEIGSNMTLISFADMQIVIDIGILFPYEDFFDINYLIPDFQDIDSNKKTILFITHGHEDHIGAIHHFIGKLQPTEIYAPNFAKELIHQKLHKNNTGAKVLLYDQDSLLQFGDFSLKPFRVNHSIPDTYGVIMHQGDTAALYISDFKVDPHASLEPVIDLDFLRNYLGKFSRKIFLLDSTNILNPGKTPSEQELIPDLEKLVQSPKRVFITLFSSNIHRIKNINSLAMKHKKRVVVSGRSLWFYLQAAKNCGLLSDDEFNNLIEYDVELPRNYIVLLTGCQGEHFGSLRKLAIGEHPRLELRSGDIVAFSSKVIPGNEKKIYRIMNSITEKGADIITASEMQIHASGHPGQEDLKMIINAVSPTHYIPIHGETYFLRKHVEFVNSNWPQIQTIFMLNGHCLKIDQQIRSIADTSNPPVIIHGANIEIERERISERRKMATTGLVLISIGKQEIKLTHKGLPNSILDLDSELLQTIRLLVGQFRKLSQEEMCEKIRIAVRNFYNGSLGYKPVVVVHAV